jgi:hypothetical protein
MAVRTETDRSLLRCDVGTGNRVVADVFCLVLFSGGCLMESELVDGGRMELARAGCCNDNDDTSRLRLLIVVVVAAPVATGSFTCLCLLC